MGIGNLQQSPKTPVKGYVQGSFNVANMPKAPVLGDVGVKAGIQVEKKGFHAGAEAGIGFNLMQAKAEVGHKFDLNNKWDLDLTGKAEYKTQYGSPKNWLNLSYDVQYGDAPSQNYQVNETWEWNHNEIRLGAKAEANYTTGNFKLGAGIEGGYRANSLYDINSHLQVEHEANGENQVVEAGYNLPLKSKGAYITPTVSAEFNAGKGISFVAKGDIYQGEAGVRFTF